MQYRLITYNIHKGIGGVDRQYRPERIIETLATYDADVIFLQEVDEGMPRSRGHRQVDLIGDALQLPYRAFQRNVSKNIGYYGNAILSRHPLERIQSLDLTIPLKKRRGALLAHCVLPGARRQKVQLVNCHLGLSGIERVVQMRKILLSNTIQDRRDTFPAIVAGDYNDLWGTLGRRVLEPAGFQAGCNAAKTFPAIMPLRSLDRIFYCGELRFDHSFSARGDLARHASDHLPLIADFEVLH